MNNFKILDGIFAGKIVGDTRILDVSFDDMPIELQSEISAYSELRGFPMATKEDEEFAIEQYEDDLELEFSDEEVTLLPMSQASL